jgi:hypothetical protein
VLSPLVDLCLVRTQLVSDGILDGTGTHSQQDPVSGRGNCSLTHNLVY